MADLKVEVVKIEEVKDHENADRLSLATVFGYTVVIGKDQYKSGDCAVYFPVDSILPDDLEDVIFAGSKVQLNKHRVRAARIRGVVSQGLLVDIPKIKKYYFDREVQAKHGKFYWRVGSDLTEALGVTKHDSEKNKPAALRGQAAKKKDGNPFFRKYTKIQHFKKNHRAFDNGDPVYVTEKIHGTNFRAGWVPTVARTWIDKIRIKLNMWVSKKQSYRPRFAGVFEPVRQLMLTLVCSLSLPAQSFVYGSHNVQLKAKATTYHDVGKTNVYEQCVIANDLVMRIPFGQVWYGEIYGPGIQKGYGYGLSAGEFGVRFFDVQDSATGTYFSFPEMRNAARFAGLAVVPHRMELFNLERINDRLNNPPMTSGVGGNNIIAEGIVIRPYTEERWNGDRKILKWISDSYLLKKGMTEYK